MKKYKKSKYLDTDLEINITYAKVKVYVSDDIYDEEDIENIERIVKTFSRDISIDKTYVAYKDTKFSKHFLSEEGWDELCHILKITKYSKKATYKQNETLQSAYYLMILCYIYMCLKDFGYDSDGIYLEIPEKSYYMVEVKIDTYREYLRYPGKWQSWNSLS